MLQVGVNSYVSVEDADEYFSTVLNSDSWINAIYSDKEKALITATRSIEKLKFQGIKAVVGQPLQFPRALYVGTNISFRPTQYNNYLNGWMVQNDIPSEVKNAVCEEALSLLKGIPKRIQLQKQGVKSFTIGDLQESYTDKSVSLISQDAIDFLSPFLTTSFDIC